MKLDAGGVLDRERDSHGDQFFVLFSDFSFVPSGFIESPERFGHFWYVGFQLFQFAEILHVIHNGRLL